MKKLLNIIYLLFIFFSCENSTGVDITKGGAFIPFEIGNNWQYARVKYKFDRADSSTYLSDSTSIMMEVVSLDSIGKFSGFILENIPFWFSYKPGSRVYYYKYDGLYYAQSPPLVYPQPEPSEYKLLSFPTSNGDINKFGTFDIETVSTNDVIELFSKIYHCIKYSVSSDGKVVGELWIAPQIGIIKSWQYFGVNTYYYYLRNYTLI